MRALTTRTPFLAPRDRDFESLISRLFGAPDEWVPRAATGRWIPPLESYVKDGELVVRVDVPGIDPNALEISVEGDRLNIKGERKDSREDENGGRTYREVVYGAFERTVTLPWDVDSDSVKAACKDGVLEITVPKSEAVKPRAIEIKS